MKPLSFISIFVFLLSCNGPAPHISVHVSNDSARALQMPAAAVSTTKELSCKLTSKELRERKETVLALLKGEAREKKELSNGYSFKFDGGPEILEQLTDFIKSERACCNFFVFTLVVADEESAIWMTITGPEGVKEFIRTEMGL